MARVARLLQRWPDASASGLNAKNVLITPPHGEATERERPAASRRAVVLDIEACAWSFPEIATRSSKPRALLRSVRKRARIGQGTAVQDAELAEFAARCGARRASAVDYANLAPRVSVGGVDSIAFDSEMTAVGTRCTCFPSSAHSTPVPPRTLRGFGAGPSRSCAATRRWRYVVFEREAEFLVSDVRRPWRGRLRLVLNRQGTQGRPTLTSLQRSGKWASSRTGGDVNCLKHDRFRRTIQNRQDRISSFSTRRNAHGMSRRSWDPGHLRREWQRTFCAGSIAPIVQSSRNE